MEELILKLKEQIVQALNLNHLAPKDIGDDQPLFGEADGLGLDSIDVLELIVLLQQEYGIIISNPTEGKDVFTSVRSMATYITNHKSKP